MSYVEEAWEVVDDEGGKHLDGDDTDKIPNWDLLCSDEGLAKISKKTRAKLERVRKVVVDKFGFKPEEEGNVTLRDAAVSPISSFSLRLRHHSYKCLLLFLQPIPDTAHAYVGLDIAYVLDCQMGMPSRRSSRGVTLWCCGSDDLDSNWESGFRQ